MKLWDAELQQEVWYTVRSNKRRSIVTTLGVFFGMLFLTLMVSVGIGIENSINKSVDSFGKNIYFFYTDQTTKPYKGYKANRSIPITYNDLISINKRFGHESRFACSTMWNKGKSWETSGVIDNKKEEFMICGVSEDYLSINAPRLLSGRLIRPHEITDKRPVCIIGVNTVKKLGMEKEEVIGHHILVDNIAFRVIGVIEETSGISINVSYSAGVFVPLNYAIANDNQSEVVLVAQPNDGVTGDEIKAKIFSYLSRKYTVHPDDKEILVSFSVDDLLQLLNMIISGVNILVWLIGLGTLMTGVISVSNILLVTIRERQREIGIRRALGAKPRDIIRQFMSESVMLIGLAGFLGMFVGLLLCLLIGSISEQVPEVGGNLVNPYPTPLILLISILIILIAGVGAGLLPVSQAIKIKAIDAIRDE